MDKKILFLYKRLKLLLSKAKTIYCDGEFSQGIESGTGQCIAESRG
jgi:hypothetical protein